MLENEVVLRAEGIGMVFNTGSDRSVTAIADIGFELRRGEVVAIVGPSGCGKTTLFNIIAGLLVPTNGRVSVSGKPVHSASGHVGYMLQKDLLLPWRTVLDNVIIGLQVRKTPRQEAERIARILIEAYGLKDFEQSYPSSLSGGMRQRVAFMRTLAFSPDVVLLDEPFSALDSQTRLILQTDVLRIIRERNCSVVLVTHDVGEAITMADRIVVITSRPGRVKSVHDVGIAPGLRHPLKIRNYRGLSNYTMRSGRNLGSNLPPEGADLAMPLNYEIAGREDGAETVVLSAGLGGVHTFWQPQIEALGKEFRLILYDHRGTGKNRECLPDNYSIAMMTDDVIEILASAGVGKCHFVGHALGGLVGLDLALRKPDLVDRLVLVNAWAKPNPHTERCFQVRKQLLNAVGIESYVHAQPIFLYPADWLVENTDRVAREEQHGIREFQGVATILKRIDALLAFDVSHDLGNVRTPTMVAASRDDILVPWSCSTFMAENLPNCHLSLVQEGGHGFTVTAATGFNTAAMAFLSQDRAD